MLSEQVAEMSQQGPVIICGDFNARCGKLDMNREGIPTRIVTDVVKNNQGEAFVDFVRSVDMGVVNGRKGIDGFTCVLERGSSVVDYCIVGEQNMGLIDNFKVTTMNESIEEMKLDGIAVRVSDH